MRLIDADSLKYRRKDYSGYDDVSDEERKRGILFLLKEDITDAPTIDPMRHGRWINDKGLYKCSACDNLWTTWWAVVVPEERMYKEMKYCPNCGARMDEERSEDE